ncbi:PREDICTED: uncharacterized protein LOC104737700 [Camelina sativa]|uniref:Uncharacterized protein LOC104737700 n=1 Tax=Camelina sativa TaxID=90675 RepID=A0ABM0VHK2_CAMSA|nr:PREDICTED: uncharacterized protein LOC104737700 [Camelina sativa]
MATTTTKIFGFVLVILTLLLGRSCSAAVYKVKNTNSDGWIANKDVYDWTEGQEFFHVGDSLFFEYNPTFNDVTLVSDALEYDLCDSSSPKAVYNTGHDVVTFTEPGYHYFISSNQAQCTLGQKLDVLVVYDLSLPIPPPQPSKILLSGLIYRVGDSSVPKESDFYYYNKWAEDKLFHVIDDLQSGNEVNNVLEISGDLECIFVDPTSPLVVHRTGHDLVTLTKPEAYYFISSETDHFEAELRIIVGPIPNARKVSPIVRLTRWFRSFRPHHH